MSGRRIDADHLANPVVLQRDTIGNDWHVRLGPAAGMPFTFVTADQAAQIAEAWTHLAAYLAERDEPALTWEREP